jgi:nucleoside 2-deoxyribosyltransferase
MHACRAGIAIFERVESDRYNANVALEAGYMIALGKPVGFLKERTVNGLQSDLGGHIWYPFDIHQPGTISETVEKWLREDRFI